MPTQSQPRRVAAEMTAVWDGCLVHDDTPVEVVDQAPSPSVGRDLEGPDWKGGEIREQEIVALIALAPTVLVG